MHYNAITRAKSCPPYPVGLAEAIGKALAWVADPPDFYIVMPPDWLCDKG